MMRRGLFVLALLAFLPGCLHRRALPVMRPERIASISDLHLGDPRSVLDDAEGREQLFVALRAAVADDHVHTLVLDGDALELSLASEGRAWTVARSLFSGLAQIDGLERVVVVAGNHDHRLFEEIPGEPAGKLGRPFDSGTPFHRELAGSTGELRVSLVYPDWNVQLDAGDVHFTHGHYFDRMTTPSFDGATSFEEIEARNASWYAFITAGGRDPLTRAVYRSLYHFGQHFTGLVGMLEGHPDPVSPATSDRTVERVGAYVTTVLRDDRTIAVVAGHTHHAGGLEAIVKAGDREILLFDTGAFVASHTGLETRPFLFELDVHSGEMRLVPIAIPEALMRRAEGRAFSTEP